MTRTLKFRAWSKTNKRMLGRVLAGPGDPCSIVWEAIFGEWLQFDDACGEIMQFTGLLDKNGREIYEGDILGFGPHGNMGVYFEGGAFKTIDNEFRFYLGDYELSVLEVIGNIYENPDLLPLEVYQRLTGNAMKPLDFYKKDTNGPTS